MILFFVLFSFDKSEEKWYDCLSWLMQRPFSFVDSSVGLRPVRTISFDGLNDVPSKKSTTSQMASLEAIPKSSPETKEDAASSSSLSSSQSSGRPEYLGICVPVDISMIFQVLRIRF